MKRKAVVLSAYEFMKAFSSEEKAVHFFEQIRWPKDPICPSCHSKRISKRKFPYYRCKDCRDIFTVRTGTVFHRSKIKLAKWFYAAYLLQTARKGVSSLQLSKQIGVTQKTAWFMLHRLREACKTKSGMFSGIITSDETYFGGEAKNKHAKDKPKKKWTSDKTMVQGLLSDKQIKFFIMDRPGKKSLKGNIRDNVKKGSVIMTDELKAYKGLNKDFKHLTVNHTEGHMDIHISPETFHFKHLTVNHTEGQYVNPLSGATTNDIESVWALMKRRYKGVYHRWSKKHLSRYFDEFAFRLDKGSCQVDTIDRIKALIEGSLDKRLTYQRLIK